MYEKDIEKVLISKEEISKRLKIVAKQISDDYKNKDVLFVCVLRGAFMFFADLVREVSVNAQVDFIAVSSYGAGTTTSGEVKLVKDLTTPIDGKNVLIVEDIVDTGVTLKYLKNNLMSRQPASIKICTLLDKPERRKVELVPEYSLFTVPNEFVIGYGLDYNENYRTLKDVCVLSPSVYREE
ncbi:MAG: hypoxanthine phosphoribosyltransferase [Clostridia bacterium]